MRHSIFYIIPALYSLHNVSGAYFSNRNSLLPGEEFLQVLTRDTAAKPLVTRNLALPEKDQLKLANEISTTSNPSSIRNVEQVNSRNAPLDDVIVEAAKGLALATQKVDDIIMILQNQKSSGATIQKAAQDALKLEAEEDSFRQALAGAAVNATDAQGKLSIIRDQGPVVIGGFREIEKNFQDKKKVLTALKEIILARLQVVAVNNALIGGIRGGDRKLISTYQLISPSLEGGGGRQLDAKLKQTVEEAQKKLTAQMKKFDEAIAVIQRSTSSPQEIEAAAQLALNQEAEEVFLRQVLASAAADSKAAMEALAAIVDREPSDIIGGLKAIQASASDAASVKRNIDIIVKGRQVVAQANLKLIQLTSTSSNPKQLQSANDINNRTTNPKIDVNSSSTASSNSTKEIISSTLPVNNIPDTTENPNAKTLRGNGNGQNINESSNNDLLDSKKNGTNSGSAKLLKDSNSKVTTNEPKDKKIQALLASLSGDDTQETSVVLFGSAAKTRANNGTSSIAS